MKLSLPLIFSAWPLSLKKDHIHPRVLLHSNASLYHCMLFNESKGSLPLAGSFAHTCTNTFSKEYHNRKTLVLKGFPSGAVLVLDFPFFFVCSSKGKFFLGFGRNTKNKKKTLKIMFGFDWKDVLIWFSLGFLDFKNRKPKATLSCVVIFAYMLSINISKKQKLNVFFWFFAFVAMVHRFLVVPPPGPPPQKKTFSYKNMIKLD